jgi:hypothetical protein
MNDWRPGPSAEQLQAIQRLSPEAMRVYLTSEGWLRHETAREVDLWTLAEGTDEFEVLVPADRRLRDFPLRMYDVLRTLATIQDRPLPTVLADLTNTGADRMILRLLPTGPPGTIPLFHGTDAVQGVQELVLAATYASTVDLPQPVQGRRPQQVRDFAREVRLGTPQAGSWVISVEVDIPEPDVPEVDVPEVDAPEAGLAPHADGGEPFARRVSRQLHSGVRATFLAAGEALREDSAEPFLRRVQDGVSANVCEALASVGRDDTPFEVRFAWAQRLPAQVGAGHFRFDRQLIRTIRSAGKTLRNALPDGPVEIIGMVTKLHRERQGAGSASVSGRVRTRYGVVDQRVTVRLTPVQHEAAIRAYEAQRYIRVVGEVRLGRVDIVRRLEVVDPRNPPENDR